MRQKVKILTRDGQACQWGGELSRDWLEMFPESTGMLYVDGHVRVYNGSQTELPRHYVARQRRCLHAQPFIMVKMWGKGIACLTYHKYPSGDWPESELSKENVPLVSGHCVEMEREERGTLLGNKVWVREIRKLTKSGHQTAIVTTNHIMGRATTAAAMFARWSQENFFKYMREHFNLDRLIDYSTEDIPETTWVVSPLYREAGGEVKKRAAHLGRKRCECNEVILCDDIEPEKVVEYEAKKLALQEEVETMEKTLEELKACRKATPHHVMLSDLPKEDQFRKRGTKSKYFIDTIKLIAYRAKTALVNIAGQTMSHQNEVRRLLRRLYVTEADILADYEKKTLTVRLHNPANRCNGVTVKKLCRELNEHEISSYRFTVGL